jgi:hypothetical protein
MNEESLYHNCNICETLINCLKVVTFRLYWTPFSDSIRTLLPFFSTILYGLRPNLAGIYVYVLDGHVPYRRLLTYSLRQNNVQKKKDKMTYNDLQNTTQKFKDQATQSPLKQNRAVGRINSSCSTCYTRHN